ncbi:MAG TPA: protein phosphatase 2C domain-containing protein [Gammaproteobacteria bacterium]|nr:protein phosphatase 2C domain-containing protein [Gammaproteobacteria bacterium]
MNIETAQATRLGNRRENQDRAAILIGDTRILLIVADGMGGHSDGAAAAQAAVDSLSVSFKNLRGRKTGKGFLREALAAAHEAVFKLGAEQPIAKRPRTTCTICLVDEGVAQWAHVGDSRVYWVHEDAVGARTRDHSAVEALYQAGEISNDDMLTHPLRNYVEECLGGEPEQPKFEIAEPVELSAGDIMLLCTDGLWGALTETDIVKYLRADGEFDDVLEDVARRAEAATHPSSDNVTAAALRWGV